MGELADELMDRVARIVPVLPVSLVCEVLLGDVERAWTELELKAAVQARLVELEAAGAAVYIPHENRGYAVEVGLRMLVLRHIVTSSDGVYSANGDDLSLVRYYANAIAHWATPGRAAETAAETAAADASGAA
ncbi:MAG: hypothetical protein HKP30_10110 [Myxococcales bacterium]|nr:hypothetical protein [Myxococcales bacterium]